MSENLSNTELGLTFKMTPEIAVFLERYAEKVVDKTIDRFSRAYGFRPKTKKSRVSFNYVVKVMGVSRHKLDKAILNGQIEAHKLPNGRYEVNLQSVENFFHLQY
jgi:hypothetical protein